MKKIISIIAFTLATIISSQAQFNYQATLRDGDGNLLNDQTVTFQTSIISSTSTPVYVESHAVTSTESGVVNFKVGEGTATTGDFSTIIWSEDYSLKVEVDIAGGTAFTDLGTTALSFMPYAEYANLSGTATSSESANTATVSQSTNSVASVTAAERDLLALEVGRLVYNSDAKKIQGVVLADGMPVLDEQMIDVPTSGNAVDATRLRTGQEFIATKTGLLSQIDVNITSVSSAGTFNLVIYRGSADYNGSVSAVHTQAFDVTAADWYEIIFDTPLDVTQDEQLVWSIQYISNGSIGVGRLGGDPYANGRSCTSFSCGAGCCDLNFKSFIIANGPVWIDLH